MNKIFISYRRDDTASICGRIYDRLCMRFGRENVFKDVEGIPLGVNFEEYVGSVVAQCAVQLVIIGPGWITASTQPGDRRLDDPHDLVRIEVEAALKRNIPVIPVMVQGATIPHSSTLPPSMQGLLGKNGLSIGNDPHFDPDMNLLIASLERWLATPAPSMVGPAGTPTWSSQTTSPIMGAGAPPSTPLSSYMPMPATWQGAPTPAAPVGGSPGYGTSAPITQGGAAPSAYAGVMSIPQAMAAPPTIPAMPPASPVASGGSVTPQPPSKRRTITITAVAGVVVALVIVGVLVLRAVTNASGVTGTWYGRWVWSSSSTGASISFEVYLDLNENGGNITGTGSLCDNTNGATNGLGTFDVTGTDTNSQVTISFTDTTDNVQINLSGPLSSNSMSLNGNLTSSSGPVSTQTTLQHGSQSDYQTACAGLPPISSGTGG